MKKKILESLGNISGEYLAEADAASIKKERSFFSFRKLAISAVCVLLVLIGVTHMKPEEKTPLINGPAFMALNEVKATDEDLPEYDEYKEIIANVADFSQKTFPFFLNKAGNGNVVYSPVNIYLALSMVTEISDGSTRQQLLDALGFKNTQQLEQQIQKLWRAINIEDDTRKVMLNNSLWLRSDMEYSKDPLNRLAQYHFASAYSGQMGSNEMNEAFHDWINEKTNNLLKEQAESLDLDADTIMALVSALYFKDNWLESFEVADTHPETFHAPEGDVTVDMMHSYISGTVFSCEGFTAYMRDMVMGGRMIFIRPNDSTDVSGVINSASLYEFLKEPYEADQFFGRVYASIPKFDVTSEADIIPALKALGITDMFSPDKADFKPLTSAVNDLYVSDVQHDARIILNEEGVEAAAFTALIMKNTSLFEQENIEFTLDRPFIFVLQSAEGVTLFTGIINRP